MRPTPDHDHHGLAAVASRMSVAAAISSSAIIPWRRWNPTAGTSWARTHPAPSAACYLDYTLAGGIAEQITCPTLVCDAEGDIFFAGQLQELFDHLTCPRTLLRLTNAEGAGAHRQTGAQRLARARIYEWLDDTLATSR